MKRIPGYLIAFCLLAFGPSCSHVSSRSYATDIFDHQSKPIRQATVIPLVSTRTGLRFGPDGAGTESRAIIAIGMPFLWNSGDDLLQPGLRSSATMLVPMVGVGSEVRVYKWLVLMKGYQPLMITNEKSSIYYSGGAPLTAKGQSNPPFRLRSGGDEVRRRIVETLTAGQPDKNAIGAIFDWDIDRVYLSEKARDLIQMQK